MKELKKYMVVIRIISDQEINIVWITYSRDFKQEMYISECLILKKEVFMAYRRSRRGRRRTKRQKYYTMSRGGIRL